MGRALEMLTARDVPATSSSTVAIEHWIYCYDKRSSRRGRAWRQIGQKIHYHKTQQNTDRTARTAGDVVVCRSFTRSIPSTLATANEALSPATRR
jgi:hypothetical protein